MKNYTITVNGNVYDVTVEEKMVQVQFRQQHQLQLLRLLLGSSKKQLRQQVQEVSR